MGLRQQQAKALRLWAAATDPARDRDGRLQLRLRFATQAGNAAFTEFLSDDTWKWARPDPLVDTNWADHDGNGSDDYPGSMLDFVFVAGAARGWEATCSVVVRAGDFPDDQTTSDHRPVSCVIDVPVAKSGESIEADPEGAGRPGCPCGKDSGQMSTTITPPSHHGHTPKNHQHHAPRFRHRRHRPRSLLVAAVGDSPEDTAAVCRTGPPAS